jgi:uncharacterized membrane protein
MLSLKLFASLLPIMAVIDLTWIGIVMYPFYKAQIGHLMAASVNWVPAAIFYIIYLALVVYFVVEPGVRSGNFWQTVVNGALLGFLAYATYDLSNHATLKDWPVLMTVVDMAWGTCITAILAAIGFFLGGFLA